MKDESEAIHRSYSSFIPHPSSFPGGRRSQVVRQRSAKPLFIGSIPIAASTNSRSVRQVAGTGANLTLFVWVHYWGHHLRPHFNLRLQSGKIVDI